MGGDFARAWATDHACSQRHLATSRARFQAAPDRATNLSLGHGFERGFRGRKRGLSWKRISLGRKIGTWGRDKWPQLARRRTCF